MKKCVLVNCFSMSNEMRVEPIREVLSEMGYETIYVSSDFNHSKKTYQQLPETIEAIHVPAYSKNLSVGRLYSHYRFSANVLKRIVEIKPDLLYVKFPPNSLVRAAYKYKLKNPECKIIIDLFDLWPEALPIPCFAKKMLTPITAVWGGLRDRYLSCADIMLTECNMYQHLLKDLLPKNVYTLYLTKKDIKYQGLDSDNNKLRVCYLGGINNLIDLEAISIVLKHLSNQIKTTLEIIGDGSRREELISVAKDSGCNVNFHGILFDDEKKLEIMQQCDFGLNLMKKTTKVALTLKSIEYLRCGLALINNIPYDTQDIIEREKCGINYFDKFSYKFDYCNLKDMKKNARSVYEQYFEYEIIKSKLREILQIHL